MGFINNPLLVGSQVELTPDPIAGRTASGCTAMAGATPQNYNVDFTGDVSDGDVVVVTLHASQEWTSQYVRAPAGWWPLVAKYGSQGSRGCRTPNIQFYKRWNTGDATDVDFVITYYYPGTVICYHYEVLSNVSKVIPFDFIQYQGDKPNSAIKMSNSRNMQAHLCF